jgi:hypothetical protein
VVSLYAYYPLHRSLLPLGHRCLESIARCSKTCRRPAARLRDTDDVQDHKQGHGERGNDELATGDHDGAGSLNRAPEAPELRRSTAFLLPLQVRCGWKPPEFNAYTALTGSRILRLRIRTSSHNVDECDEPETGGNDISDAFVQDQCSETSTMDQIWTWRISLSFRDGCGHFVG